MGVAKQQLRQGEWPSVQVVEALGQAQKNQQGD